MESPQYNMKSFSEGKVGFAQFASVISDTNPLRSITIIKLEEYEGCSVCNAIADLEDFLTRQYD